MTEGTDYEGKTRAELDEEARARGLNPDDYANKQELIDALNENQQPATDEGYDAPQPVG